MLRPWADCPPWSSSEEDKEVEGSIVPRWENVTHTQEPNIRTRRLCPRGKRQTSWSEPETRAHCEGSCRNRSTYMGCVTMARTPHLVALAGHTFLVTAPKKMSINNRIFIMSSDFTFTLVEFSSQCGGPGRGYWRPDEALSSQLWLN